MSGSKPEELVAKLYEEGMTDDEVKAQLSDFGLSGREVHVLMKKARNIIDDNSKRQSRASPPPPSMPLRNEPRGLSNYTNIVKKGSNIAVDSSSLDAESELLEKPIDELGTGGLDRFWSQKNGTEESSNELEGLKSLLPEPPAVTKREEKVRGKRDEGGKKSFFGLFGKKGTEQKGMTGGQIASSPIDQKLEKLRGHVSGQVQSPSLVDQKLEKLRSQVSSPSQSPWLSGNAAKEVGKVGKNEDKKPGKKEDKKGSKKSAAEEESYQIKMKRLALIKESISRPIIGMSTSGFVNIGEDGSLAKEEPVVEIVQEPPKLPEPEKLELSVQPKRTEFPRLADEITLTSNEDEEKMDQELASKLLSNMKNMETEMGEIRQLLETLRELNIKLIEILEMRK